MLKDLLVESKNQKSLLEMFTFVYGSSSKLISVRLKSRYPLKLAKTRSGMQNALKDQIQEYQVNE